MRLDRQVAGLCQANNGRQGCLYIPCASGGRQRHRNFVAHGQSSPLIDSIGIGTMSRHATQ